MNRSHTILASAIGIALSMAPVEAQAGWQGRRAKCVKPDSEITAEQQQSLSAAVRGGTPVWNAAGEVDQASASATTRQVLSQGAFNQAWIRYELCMALDNNHIDQDTYNRLLERSLQGSFSGTAPANTAGLAATPAPVPAASTPAASPASSSGTEWMQQLQAQTQLRSSASYADMATYGYSLVDVASTGLLNASDSTSVPLSLPPGYEYAVMGVCDNDCSDLDLTVLKSGVELSVDTSTDDWPVVKVVPTGSADYAIKVSMYRCATTNCGYQLTVWRRATDSSTSSSTPSSSSGGVSPGSVSRGTLAAGDFTLPNGEWSDRYTVPMQSGQSVTISMTSSDIDTYIVAQSPSGATEGNDDCDGDRSSSCLSFVAAESGDWTIYATSYQANDDGTYALQVEVR